MIRVEQAKLPEVVQRRVREFIVYLPSTQCLDHGTVRNAAEGQDDRRRGQQRQFFGKKAIAGIDLGADRFVIGRQAFHRVRNAAIDQRQRIIGGFRMIVRTEPVFVQHLVQENARMIAGEWTPGAVGTVQAGCKTYYQEPRIRHAKGRHRAAIIVRVSALNIVKKSGEPRTVAARFIKDRFVHASITHVADDGASETPRANQASTRNQFLKFLLDFFLVVRPNFAFGRTNSGA